MSPTNEQIITEARRRAKEQNWRMDVEDYIIEVMREGWTPHEPVDPDLLAFRAWLAGQLYYVEESEGSITTKAFLAGYRLAREKERERAKVPIRMAEELADRCRRLLCSLPAGVHDQLDVKWGLDALCRAVEAEIAKYLGEA